MTIAAIVMEWFFEAKGEDGPCPRHKVEELTRFFLDNDYSPFAFGIIDNTIVKLDTSKCGTDWFSNALVWLHRPSMPNDWTKNDTIALTANRAVKLFYGYRRLP